MDYHTLEKGRYPRELDLSFSAYAKGIQEFHAPPRPRGALETLAINLGGPIPIM